MQLDTQVLQAPVRVLAGDALGDAVAQAIGMTDALSFYNFHWQIINVLARGFCYYNVPFRHGTSFLYD
jgi:hypothetical protein